MTEISGDTVLAANHWFTSADCVDLRTLYDESRELATESSSSYDLSLREERRAASAAFIARWFGVRDGDIADIVRPGAPRKRIQYTGALFCVTTDGNSPDENSTTSVGFCIYGSEVRDGEVLEESRFQDFLWEKTPLVRFIRVDGPVAVAGEPNGAPKSSWLARRAVQARGWLRGLRVAR